MKVLFGRKVIEMTKAEMKAAEVYGSDMYKALLDAQKNFPDFNIKVKMLHPFLPMGATQKKRLPP